jgi:hypothetical protein
MNGVSTTGSEGDAFMESHMNGAQVRPPNAHLVQIADELLDHTRALRRQHEELRDRLAGITAVPADQPFSPPDVRVENRPPGTNGHDGEQPNGLYLMVLQMALAGETPEAAREQLHALGGDVENADELVSEVFERVGEQRPDDRRRRLFSR